jgi:outer membrane protein TolC
MTLVSLATVAALLASSMPGVRAQDANAVPLSLTEALTKALENNLDLRIAQKDPLIAWNDVLFQKAQFDPLFTSTLSHTEFKSELSPFFIGGNVVYASPTSKSTDISAEIRQLLNFGASYSVGLTSQYNDSNPFNTYNPQYSTGLTLRFNLPLLKGFGRETTEYALLVAKQNIDISHEVLREQSTTTIRAVEDAYWDLLASMKAQEVAEQALKLAQDLADLNKKKVDVGTLAPIEITQAEANVAANVEGVITTKLAVKNAEDNLRRLLAIPPEDPLWTKSILPTEEPAQDQRTPNLDEAIATALKARPELLQSEMQLKNAQLGERVAKKNARHTLDLTASVNPTGNNLITQSSPGPDGIPGTPDDYETGGLGRGLGEIPNFDNYSFFVGLTYAVPIRNRAAEADYANATIAREKAELFEQNTADVIRVDVRRAVRAVESGYERVVAARKNVELQNKKLEAEQKKFDNGMSTSFEVFTFQTDLRNAQLSLIRAMLDYNKSLADLERAKGTLLESKGLKLAEDSGR